MHALGGGARARRPGPAARTLKEPGANPGIFKVACICSGRRLAGILVDKRQVFCTVL